MSFATKPINVLARFKRAQRARQTISVKQIGAMALPASHASEGWIKSVRRTTHETKVFSAVWIRKDALLFKLLARNVIEMKSASLSVVWMENALRFVGHLIHATMMQFARNIDPISFARPLRIVEARRFAP
jgi:hypothetical protein